MSERKAVVRPKALVEKYGDDFTIIIESYLNGESISKLAEIYGYKQSTLNKRLTSLDEWEELKVQRDENIFNSRIEHIVAIGSDIKLEECSNHRLLFSEWKGKTTDKYWFKCTECGEEWINTQFTYVYNNNGIMCKDCMKDNTRRSNSMPYSDVIKIISDMGSEIRLNKDEEMKEECWGRVIDKYWFKCPNCSEWFNREYRDSIKDKCLCHKCGNRYNFSWDIESVKEYCMSVGSEFLSKEWKTQKDKYKFKCTSCSCVIIKSFEKFESGQTRCKVCSYKVIGDKTRHSHEWYLNELNKRGINIMPLEEYVNMDTPIKHKCPVCNNQDWLARPDHILNKESCSCVNCTVGKSIGQQIMEEYLDSINIKYIPEYKFDELINPKTNRQLKIDIALFDKYDNLKGLIEYDGEFHYKVSNINPLDKLLDLRRRDFIKDDFCKTNNIPLLRIPYWEKNIISDRIDKYIKELEII